MTPQCSSSSPCKQSRTPSQTQVSSMHWPSKHRNWFTWQLSEGVGPGVGGGVVLLGILELQSISSLLSPQSFTESHFHHSGMQCWFLQVNCHGPHFPYQDNFRERIHFSTFRSTVGMGTGVVVLTVAVQLTSSEPSGQSLSPSQSHDLKMHRSLLH